MRSLKQCWCSAEEPELTKNGPELDLSDCNMLCADTTTGERCGGFYKMLVYEITSYRSCHHEVLDEPTQQEPSWLSRAEDEQIVGQPWDYQEKFDTTLFFLAQDAPSSLSDDAPAGMCDV